jgi:hypothetical protein
MPGADASQSMRHLGAADGRQYRQSPDGLRDVHCPPSNLQAPQMPRRLPVISVVAAAIRQRIAFGYVEMQ